jgi:hypothetical protein
LYPKCHPFPYVMHYFWTGLIQTNEVFFRGLKVYSRNQSVQPDRHWPAKDQHSQKGNHSVRAQSTTHWHSVTTSSAFETGAFYCHDQSVRVLQALMWLQLNTWWESRVGWRLFLKNLSQS